MPNLYQTFAESAKKHHDRKAIGFLSDGEVRHWTYSELLQRVDSFGDTLPSLGLKPGDRVGLLTENQPLWPVVDLAVAKRGLVLVPMHTVLTVDQIQKILRQSRAKALFLGSGVEDKIPKLLAGLPTEVASVVFFEAGKSPSSKAGRRYTSIPELLGQKTRPLPPEPVAGEDIATIIFTSGTTGEMKGVLLSHQGLIDSINFGNDPVNGSADRCILSVLPLSHAFERNAGLLGPLFLGTTVCYGRGIAQLVDDIQVFKPDRINAVPRLLEKIESGVRDKLRKQSSALYKVFSALLGQSQARQRGGLLSLLHLPGDRLGELVFYRKIRKKFGGKLKRVICGGAPIDPSVVEFFQAIGVQVLQGYGLTEVSPTVSVNPHYKNKVGTVGIPLGCVEVRLGENDELLVKGSSLMLGYDSEAATREAIDEEGWFHTGDQAAIDAEGYITIKGRIKEMIVTSYGKNIIPSVVEQTLEKNRLILQAVVFGHGKAFLSALIVPNRENVLAWLSENGLAKLEWEELCRHPEFKQKLGAALQEAQSGLASYEQVKRFEIIPEEFSQANDLITATLKLKRSKIQSLYEQQIQSMYRE
ncbi:MAG TPA: long-chain fatty acid--CoA ligase [bacterium]|nr:long-chain fatty acid--CoA ligase [bacterium]